MKGRILKGEFNEWLVSYNDEQGLFQFIQLHPDDVNELIKQEAFDNLFDGLIDKLETRISEFPNIEFDIVEHQKLYVIIKYAKIHTI